MEIQPWENASSSALKWPEFEANIDALYHAIGTVVSRWNEFELLIEACLARSKIPDTIVTFISHKIHNADRTELLLLLLEEIFKTDDEARIQSKIFKSYATICADNRNFIAHAQVLGQKNGYAFRLRKANRNKPGTFDNVFMTVENVRAMAQDILNTMHFSARFLTVTNKHMLSDFDGNESSAARSIIEPPPKPIKWRSYSSPQSATIS